MFRAIHPIRNFNSSSPRWTPPSSASSSAFRGNNSSVLWTEPKLLFSAAATTSNAMNSNAPVLEKYQIIPDVIDRCDPCVPLKITYNGVEPKGGMEISPKDSQTAPKVHWSSKDTTELFTLAFVDPDAPSRMDPKQREWRHWLVVNIPDSDVNKGETLSTYMGSQPPKGSGLHRYVFLLYKQPSKITAHKMDDHQRGRFSIKEFAKQHHLGNPIGAEFFQAQNK